MRNMLLVVLSFGITVIAWGVYGPVLHWGQEGMVDEGEKLARLRPFVCVGMAYFLIGVLVPAGILQTTGEKGYWTMVGAIRSFLSGALGAIGALGIIMAFTFGGKPVYVMPLVFGGAPVVNSFLTIYWAKKFKEIGPLFMAGLMMVLMGAVTVLIFAPTAKSAEIDGGFFDWIPRILAIATTIVCWGAYGPMLHRGQAAMAGSRMRPLLCVGLAYFAIAVVVPFMLLPAMPEAGGFLNNGMKGSIFSLLAGAAGAVGALGIIQAFNFGGKPVYVMPLVFGGAPVVNTLVSAIEKDMLGEIGAPFLAGLMLVIAGAVLTLVFAPKGAPPKKQATEAVKETKPEPAADAEGSDEKPDAETAGAADAAG
ncbi:MAG: hypothetical protein AAGJ46_13535 [Planctomycetota bacterium]